VDPQRTVDDRAREDSSVVWPSGRDSLGNDRIVLVVVLALVAIVGLIDIIVAQGALALFG
jgi:preprotein translocase SecE subunit